MTHHFIWVGLPWTSVGTRSSPVSLVRPMRDRGLLLERIPHSELLLDLLEMIVDTQALQVFLTYPHTHAHTLMSNWFELELSPCFSCYNVAIVNQFVLFLEKIVLIINETYSFSNYYRVFDTFCKAWIHKPYICKVNFYGSCFKKSPVTQNYVI